MTHEVEETQIQPKQRAVRVRETTLPDGRRGWEYSDGSIRNDSGHMMQPLPGVRPITNDNARELLSRRRLVGLRAQLRALARVEGVDPSDVDDELLLQAGSALEALTIHMAQTFKGSKSLRGMAEVYGVLAAPLVGDRRQKDADEPTDGSQPAIFIHIAQYIQQLREAPADVVEGEISD